MLYVFLWLLCGFAAATIYRGKGRPAATAFLVGLIFGPIGVILALLTPASAAGQARQAIASGAMKKCPRCAELIQADALVCRYCQHQLVAPGPPAPLDEGQARKTVAPNGTATCGACGGSVRAEATLCKHCKRAFVA